MAERTLSLEEAQLLALSHREGRPKLSERQAHDQLLEAMARFLHYQEKGEPNWVNIPIEALMAEYGSLPQAISDRYRNDIKFHTQVDRAVAAVLDIIFRCREWGARE